MFAILYLAALLALLSEISSSFRDRDVPANLQQILGRHSCMMASMISTLMSCSVSRQYTYTDL